MVVRTSSNVTHLDPRPTSPCVTAGDPGTSVIIKEGSIQIDGPFTMLTNLAVITAVNDHLASCGDHRHRPASVGPRSRPTARVDQNQSEQLLVTIGYGKAPSAPCDAPELLLDSDSNIIGDGITV